MRGDEWNRTVRDDVWAQSSRLKDCTTGTQKDRDDYNRKSWGKSSHLFISAIPTLTLSASKLLQLHEILRVVRAWALANAVTPLASHESVRWNWRSLSYRGRSQVSGDSIAIETRLTRYQSKPAAGAKPRISRPRLQIQLKRWDQKKLALAVDICLLLSMGIADRRPAVSGLRWRETEENLLTIGPDSPRHAEPRLTIIVRLLTGACPPERAA